MPLDIAGGWNKSNGLNRPGLERLVGNLERGQPIGDRVGEFLPGLDQHDPRRAVVGKLVDQIRQMWQDKSYMLGSNEPYEMVKRLAVLSSMVDGQVFWNCKSVKREGRSAPR
ncbi:MAG: hypothetical protein NTZ09_00515 [Candidatus Hydrogenedentes bacterium]|nr:hypothetical protein [Candidatus Hydrogenedentota bacterium]